MPLPAPGLMSLTRAVPAGVPSVFQSSGPATPSLPEKNRTVPIETLVTVNCAAELVTLLLAPETTTR